MTSKYNDDFQNSTRERRKTESRDALKNRELIQKTTNRIRKILKIENQDSLSIDEKVILQAYPEIVEKVSNNMTSRQEALKRKHDRDSEIYDSEKSIQGNVDKIAEKLIEYKLSGKDVLVYTGAGISTQAGISDYRGPEGVWTKLNRKEKLIVNTPIVKAMPTKTHIILKKLMEDGFISHIVSQNCDGLHIRSGIPKEKLSELHGNMFAEYCGNADCSLKTPIYRIFDITESTSYRKHSTGRSCPKCHEKSLKDTIIHFGEINPTNIQYPYNWQTVLELIENKNIGCILTLGSSLKVLKSYEKLFPKSTKKFPYELFIVNLQWTPKDSYAKIKIHTKCDEFTEKLMNSIQNKNTKSSDKNVNIKMEENINLLLPTLENDALWKLATPIKPDETQTINTLAIYDDNEISKVFNKNNVNKCTEQIKSKFSAELEHISSLKNPIITPAWYGLGLKKNNNKVSKSSKN